MSQEKIPCEMFLLYFLCQIKIKKEEEIHVTYLSQMFLNSDLINASYGLQEPILFYRFSRCS